MEVQKYQPDLLEILRCADDKGKNDGAQVFFDAVDGKTAILKRAQRRYVNYR